ncbi:hypothetical protein [Spirosoma pollinicola]|uniref:Uncharacterized protein n=1 Tax=Spirosoma pollinicola TaxID=2057025 RepID=A0A2K8YTI3_9BACT|nr:hypothetical protein [Spirosoma pollinicola]AUD00930.1 hypothetical protein CWM47_03330 [Spirosoma pollinicola]
MQYSVFTHGTAVEAENLSVLTGFVKVGWGTVISLKEPPKSTVGNLDVRDMQGPGTWFHIPLTSTLTTFGRSNPYLVSVTLLIETKYCRITDIHVYDGAEIVEEFGGTSGDLSQSRNSKDINPDSPLAIPETFSNTKILVRPHKLFSAIGISFFATSFEDDYKDENGIKFRGRYPQATLIVSGAGAQYMVADPLKIPLSDRIAKAFDSIVRVFKP